MCHLTIVFSSSRDQQSCCVRELMCPHNDDDENPAHNDDDENPVVFAYQCVLLLMCSLPNVFSY